MNGHRTEHEHQGREVIDALAQFRERGAQANDQSDRTADDQHATGQLAPANVPLFHKGLQHVGQGVAR